MRGASQGVTCCRMQDCLGYVLRPKGEAGIRKNVQFFVSMMLRATVIHWEISC